MKSKRILAPAFLHKLDHWLLTHKPAVWSARTHLVWWYSGLFLVILTVIGFIAPNDPRNDSNMGVFSTLMSMVSLLGLVFWLVFMLRFNVFKRFGIQSRTEGLTTFLLYFLSSFILCFLPFSTSLIETFRANQRYTDKEVVDDINTINRSIAQLWHAHLQDPWASTKYRLVKYDSAQNIIQPPVMPEDVVADTTIAVPYEPTEEGSNRWVPLDSIAFSNNKRLADSVVVINDSAFISYKCPDFEFLSPWSISQRTEGEMIRSLDIYREIISRPAPTDTAAITQKMVTLIDKYTKGKYYEYYSDNYLVINKEDGKAVRIKKTYQLDRIDDSINNIMERKHRWDASGTEVFLRIMLYCAFCLSLLIFMFRYTTAKTFFLTLLTSVLLFIFTMLVLATSGNSALANLVLLLFYYLIAGVLALTINSNSTRTIASGIGLNIFTGITAFIPLIIYGMIYSVVSDYKDFDKTHWYENRELYFVGSELLGVVLFLLLMEPVLKKGYRKWFALPEE